MPSSYGDANKDAWIDARALKIKNGETPTSTYGDSNKDAWVDARTRSIAAGQTPTNSFGDAGRDSWLDTRATDVLGGEIIEPTGPLSVLVFGDSGTGYAIQDTVANAMELIGDQNDVSLALLCGDNIYENGVSSTSDPQWQTKFEQPYADLDMPIYAVLGNHDGYGSEQAQVDYTNVSSKFKMPAKYYTFTVEDTQFFALDTLSESRITGLLSWLETELDNSTAKHKVIFGHHPIYSYGSSHGNTSYMITHILPLVEEHNAVYFCGHDHDLQHLKTDGGNDCFVSGAASKSRSTSGGTRSEFDYTGYGFLLMTFNSDTIDYTFYNQNATKLYEYTSGTVIPDPDPDPDPDQPIIEGPPVSGGHVGGTITEPQLQGRSDILFFMDMDDETATNAWLGDKKPYFSWSDSVRESGAGSVRAYMPVDQNWPENVSTSWNDEFDEAYMRWYQYYPDGFDFGRTHKSNGMYARDKSYSQSPSCKKPNGYDKYSCRVSMRTNGRIILYTYNLEQPDACGEGLDLNKDYGFKLSTGVWHKFELRIKANSVSPGPVAENDGELELWIDDDQKALYTDMAFRLTESLKLNEMNISSYQNTGEADLQDADRYCWKDQVVCATGRIEQGHDPDPGEPGEYVYTMDVDNWETSAVIRGYDGVISPSEQRYGSLTPDTYGGAFVNRFRTGSSASLTVLQFGPGLATQTPKKVEFSNGDSYVLGPDGTNKFKSNNNALWSLFQSPTEWLYFNISDDTGDGGDTGGGDTGSGGDIVEGLPTAYTEGGTINDPVIAARNDILYYQDFKNESNANSTFINGAEQMYWEGNPAHSADGTGGSLRVKQIEGTNLPYNKNDWIDPTDVMYLRWYRKYEAGYSFPWHKGCGMYAWLEEEVTSSAGVKPNGYDKFSCKISMLSGGRPFFYFYNPNQPWGSGEERWFNYDLDFRFKADRWYRIELYAKANDAGKWNGELAAWVDGKLMGFYNNIEFRKTNALKINRFEWSQWLSSKDGANGTEYFWDDDIVMATGPIDSKLP